MGKAKKPENLICKNCGELPHSPTCPGWAGDLNKEKALEIAHELMGVAENIRKTGEQVEMMFAFWVPKEKKMRLLPGAMLYGDNTQVAAQVRRISDSIGATVVFTAVEGWLGRNPMVRPSEDPSRQEAIIITASGAGINLMLTRQINEDGTLGKVDEVDGDVSGTFSNLSNREMMN